MDFLYYGLITLLGLCGLWGSSSVLIHLLESWSVRYKWSMLGLSSIVLASLTSLPELMVSLIAVLDNNHEVAMGNLMGSYAANLCLVVGVCACIKPIQLESIVFNFKFPMLLLAIFSIMLAQWLPVYLMCVLMLIFYAGYIGMTIYLGDAKDVVEDEFPQLKRVSAWVLFPLSLGCLFLSTKGVLYGAVSIASMLGVSKYWIGLTIVAIGTSLPELITSILAQYKGMDDVIVAQAVGSNIFMFLFILPIMGLMNQQVFNVVGFYDFFLLMMIVLVLFIFARYFDRKWQINRLEGMGLLFLYAGYLFFH
ncbi:MAG TPA: sodium:calcium antiporter [Gammaproteobacteria bacterium]|nr:sodium:calcium antiporter [Gammaproteobacteria bacterium]